MPDRRAAYEADPEATSAEAEVIFDAVETLLDERGAAESQTALAVELGVIGAYLPHGRRNGLLRRLLDVAPRSKRAALLTRLVLGGKHIALADVEAGITQTYEAADGKPWILGEGDGFELKSWIDLLPFTDRASDLPRVIASLHPEHRGPRFLETLLVNLPYAPVGLAEEALFELADGDSRFYQDDHWWRAALRLGTASVARRLLDRMTSGVLEGERSPSWWLARDLASVLEADPDVRAYAHGLLQADPPHHGLRAIAEIVAEAPDNEGLLLLVDLEGMYDLRVLHSLPVERAVSCHVPLDGGRGVYEVVPVPCGRLRAELLARTTDGGPEDLAARVLDWIDAFRDEHGLLDADRRHPDLASGRPWPPMRAPTLA